MAELADSARWRSSTMQLDALVNLEEGSPGVNDLADGVRVGRLALQLDGDDAEEKDLNGGAAGIPEGTAHAVLREGGWVVTK